MQSVRAIVEKSEKSIVKTQQIRTIKKEKIQAKKEAGEFVPEEEFKKAKLAKKEKKIIKEKPEEESGKLEEKSRKAEITKVKADFKKNKQLLNQKLIQQNDKSSKDLKDGVGRVEDTKFDQKKKEFVSRIDQGKEQETLKKSVDTKASEVQKNASEVKKGIQKRKQKTASFKSYDQYNRKNVREEYKKLQTEERPFRSYGVEGNLERRQRKYEREHPTAGEGKAENQQGQEGLNRRERRQHIREGYNSTMGIQEKQAASKEFKAAPSSTHYEKPKPKEWKAGSGNNGWGLDNMHPSWAAKKNLEQEGVGLISKAHKMVKIIDL